MTKKRQRPLGNITKAIKNFPIRVLPIQEDIEKIGRPVQGSAPVSEPIAHPVRPEYPKQQSDNIPVSIVKEDEQDDASEEQDDGS